MQTLLSWLNTRWTWVITAVVLWLAGILYWLVLGGGDLDLDNIMSLVLGSFVMMPQFFLLSFIKGYGEWEDPTAIILYVLFYAIPLLLVIGLPKIRKNYLPWVYLGFFLFCLLTLKGCVYDFPKEF